MKMRLRHVIVVVDTTKVQFFKQITTRGSARKMWWELLLIPQRYNFSSKSQHITTVLFYICSCCWYHKGTIFQANHNACGALRITDVVVVDTTKVQFFKQITTYLKVGFFSVLLLLIPQRYNFSSKSQQRSSNQRKRPVVVDTTKVQFFKQITTKSRSLVSFSMLLLIPQRYNFSSKSQLQEHLSLLIMSCCWYHKGTIFQANHNLILSLIAGTRVVVDTTKVQFFKQITTKEQDGSFSVSLLLIPQRYNFSSKSQPYYEMPVVQRVVVDTTKVQFFKQITTIRILFF